MATSVTDLERRGSAAPGRWSGWWLLGWAPARPLGIAALALVLSAGLACSFSYSSRSLSDSSGSSSRSSRSSSGGEKAAFQDDVTHYTVAWIDGGGRDAPTFLDGVGDLARQHGVSDWEADSGVWEAIGRGLGQSRLDPAARAGYVQAWAGGDPTHKAALEQGLAAAK
jgi:hypothetical protein